MEAVVRRFKTDLHNCVGYIQDPKMLKESIKALYQKHVQEDIVSELFSCCKMIQPVKGLSITCFSWFRYYVITDTCTHARMHAHTCMHTCMHLLAHTHTHTHTQTHTRTSTLSYA